MPRWIDPKYSYRYPNLDPTAAVTRSVGTGAIELNGPAPALGTGATMKLRGAGLSLAFVLTVGAGTLGVTGETPSSTVFAPGVTIAAVAGTTTLAGTSLQLDSGLAGTAGALTFDGPAPTVQLALVVAPDIGALMFDGGIPTVTVYDGVYPMPAGALLLVGVRPGVAVHSFGTGTGRPGLSSLSAMTGLSGGGDVC